MNIVVSPKHLIEHEILSVTTSMRKNSRWASSARLRSARDTALASSMGLRQASVSDSTAQGRERDDVDLMVGFEELKREVRDSENVMKLPLMVLLKPFLALIRSSLSTGPITSAALMSLHTFFVSGLIQPTSVGVRSALASLSNTVANCKFEASDFAGDEAVLLRIMSIIRECMCGSVGTILGDVEVCEMLETVLTICCQMRASEILRRSAELHMHALVRHVFGRLKNLNPRQEENRMAPIDGALSKAEMKMVVQAVQSPIFSNSMETLVPSDDHPQEYPSGTRGEYVPVSQDIGLSIQDSGPPYGLPSITELLRVLINLLNPMDQKHTDSTRITSLRILNTALEVSGTDFGHYASLSSIMFDHGCKYLFQLARSENPTVLYLSLRVISTLFDTLRPYLKLQQELFLAFTIDRLAPPESSTSSSSKTQLQPITSPRSGSSSSAYPMSPNPSLLEDGDSEWGSRTPPQRPTVTPARGETRELMLEMLSSLASPPSFMVDLWTNYDSDLNCEDIFERLTAFLTRGVYASPTMSGLDRQQQSAQLLCLDLLLAFVNHMTARADSLGEKWPTDAPHPEELLRHKSQKRLMLAGASRFNAKPKEGIQFFIENGLVPQIKGEDGVSKTQSLARFLKKCPRLDKKLLGDFLSRPDNRGVLDAFIQLFDFKEKTIADAMRDLLEAFRLPGESQQIERITETFAKCYFAAEPEGIKSEDAVFVLAYSVIMLNTDLHSPQVRKRMTFEDYQRNLKGVNAGSDFDPDYLKTVYDSIGKREIVMPEEHTGQVGFDHAWKELLQRARSAGTLVMCNTSLFDKAMFTLVWKPLISAVAFAFTTFDDDYVIQRAIAGFRQCATLAGTFQLPDVFDYIVQSLSHVTTLLSDPTYTSVLNHPVVEVEGREITVSSLSVKFGNNIRAQLAAVVLFTIANGNGNAVREGWTQIFEMFETLFLHALLPIRMLQMEDFLGGVSMIPLQGSQPSPHPVSRGDGGLLSALSSYLLTPYSASSEPSIPEATDAQVESTLCTIDCITACKLDELYSQIVDLELSALTAALRALHTVADRRAADRLAALSAQGPEDGVLDVPLPYDPASVFLLEMMVSIACQTPQHIEDVWSVVFDHLSNLLSLAERYSMLLIERAVVGLLRLCLIVAEKPSMRDQLYVALDALGGLPPQVLNAVAEQVLAGLVLVVQRCRDIIRSQTEWALVFSLIRRTISHPEASKLSFDMIQNLATDALKGSVTADNFAGLVAVLDDFASAAGYAVEGQRQDKRAANTSEPVVERGLKAIELIFELKRFVPRLLNTAPVSASHAWRIYSLPILVSLGHQSSSASRDVRHSAMSQLQRILLGPYITTSDNDHAQVDETFNRVVFPLLDELLKPDVFQRDPQGMPETRLRASALLCKVFLHFEMRLSQSKSDIRVLWIQILDLLDRFMNIDRRDQLYEAIPESLKNVLLVMNASEILVPPAEPDVRDERQKSMWAATQERIDRFIPSFLSDIIPPTEGPSN
ncbi:Sec7-domain-containing protein [Gautieria morchelliformis]|nr:Sec7-domain-containing protein [Gautieria morchelliformis]